MLENSYTSLTLMLALLTATATASATASTCMIKKYQKKDELDEDEDAVTYN